MMHGHQGLAHGGFMFVRQLTQAAGATLYGVLHAASQAVGQNHEDRATPYTAFMKAK